MHRIEIKSIIEALIFASDTPLSIDKMQQILEHVSKKDLESILEELSADYQNGKRGFHLKQVANGYQLRTAPEHAPWLKKLKKTKTIRLTQPTLETLAIIAYKHPITKAEIEKIRGVDSTGILKTLLERKLIYIAGRKDIPGKPFLFATTKMFLEVFGLENLSSLPSLKEIESLDDALLPSILREKLPQEMLLEGDEEGAADLSELPETEGQGTLNPDGEEASTATAVKDAMPCNSPAEAEQQEELLNNK